VAAFPCLIYAFPIKAQTRLNGRFGAFGAGSGILRAVTHPIGLTDITALTGTVVGVVALVLSVVNYLRDTPKVKVTLLWDMSVTDQPRYDTRKLWGLVTVANVGRRPVYIRVANLKLPKGYKHSHLSS
jgi:hypothetical protein